MSNKCLRLRPWFHWVGSKSTATGVTWGDNVPMVRCVGHSGRAWHSSLPVLWFSFQEKCSPQKLIAKLPTPTRRSNVLPLLPIFSAAFQLVLWSLRTQTQLSILPSKWRRFCTERTCLPSLQLAFQPPCEPGRHLQFAKVPPSSAAAEQSDDFSFLPCSPRSDASPCNESQRHSVINQATQKTIRHPPVQPACYTSTVLDARRLLSLAPLSRWGCQI